MTDLERWLEKVEGRAATIGVVGLGYVGLPVAVAFAQAGFRVFGIDFNEDKVADVNEGRSYLRDVSDESLIDLTRTGRLSAANSYDVLTDADAILICLPTPIREGTPDLSFVTTGARGVAEILRPGALVVLESTTYPGTTQELLAPLLESRGLKTGRDFYLAYSPERIDPGNELYPFGDIPKVVGGVDAASTRAATALYSQVVPKVFPVSGPAEAELSKLIENTFRHVNIALVNELAVYAHEMGIDVWQAIEAAATKPFGFVPFWPGPGWGGHCIPLDPAYLSWRVRRERSHEMRFVELAQRVNAEMPLHVAERVSLLLNERGKAVRGSRILCVGMAYKGGTGDTRESAGLRVAEILMKRGAEITYHDPFVASLPLLEDATASVSLTPEVLGVQDLVLVLVNQKGIDWDLIAAEAPLVFDCCNAMPRRSHVVRL